MNLKIWSVSRALSTVLVVITLGVFTAWFEAPLSNDSRIFFAAARQADFKGDFPQNVYQTWELKPLGHRVVIYGIYKSSIQFADFNDKVAFERSVKAVYGTGIFLVILAFVFGLHGFLKNSGISETLVFCAALLVFFSMSYLITFQPEEFSILFIMASFPLAMARSKSLNLLAGLPLAALFALKGITLLLAIELIIVLHALGDDYRQRLQWAMVSLFTWFAVIVSLFIFVFPKELADLRDATLFQGSLDFELKRLLSLPWAFWHKLQFTPFLAPSVVLIWLSLPLLLLERKWGSLTLLAGVIAVSGMVVVVQGLFFGYHYAVFVIPAGITTFMLYRLFWNHLTIMTPEILRILSLWALALMVLLALGTYVDRGTTDVVSFSIIGYNLAVLLLGFVLFLGWMFLVSKISVPISLHHVVLIGIAIVLAGALWARYQSPWSIWGDQSRISEAQRQVYGKLDEQYLLSQEPQLLYLSSSGDFPYYLPAPTYCRHFTTEPLARIFTNVASKKLLDSQVHRELLSCVMSYKGQYILSDPDWPIQEYPSLAEKIAAEYIEITKVDQLAGIVIYKTR